MIFCTLNSQLPTGVINTCNESGNAFDLPLSFYSHVLYSLEPDETAYVFVSSEPSCVVSGFHLLGWL